MSNTAAAMERLKARFQSPPKPSETHGILRERDIGQRRAGAGEDRVQKNLRLLRHDAERMVRMAREDGISQTKLMSLALDAYEKSRNT